MSNIFVKIVDDNGDDDNLTNIQEEETQFNIRQNKHTDEGHEDHYQSDADNDWLEVNHVTYTIKYKIIRTK